MFTGTGSVAKALRAQGYEVLTLDFDERWKPDILVDIRRWDYKQFRPGDFHLVAASPPCMEYSTIMISRPRRLDEADELVNRAREIIEYLQPELWWIENPRRGLLSRRSPVRGLRFIDVDYCMLSDWGYQTPTRFWCCDQIAQRGSVLCNGNCGNMVRHDDGVRRHRLAIGSRRAPSKVQMMAIPAGVIHHLCGFEGPPQGVLQVQVKAWQQHPQPPFQIGQVERRGGAVQLLMRISVLDGGEQGECAAEAPSTVLKICLPHLGPPVQQELPTLHAEMAPVNGAQEQAVERFLRFLLCTGEQSGDPSRLCQSCSQPC